MYVLESAEGRYYVGQTEDLAARVVEHNRPGRSGSKYTAKGTNSPSWRLVWSEPHATRAAAMARERQIKAMKSARWIREHLLNPAERVPARRD